MKHELYSMRVRPQARSSKTTLPPGLENPPYRSSGSWPRRSPHHHTWDRPLFTDPVLVEYIVVPCPMYQHFPRQEKVECQSHSNLRLPPCYERLLALSNPCWTLPVGCSLVHRGWIESTINLYPAKGKAMAMSAATTSLEWPDWGVS